MPGKPSLLVPFHLRGHAGRVVVRYEVNDDPIALGHDLCAVGFDAETFLGFPVIEARVEYEGRGYRAVFGWVQFITHLWVGRDEREVSVDLWPFLADIDNPMVVYGYLPTLFDAPANPDHPDGDWVAESFLVAGPDIARTRRLGAALGLRWGYRLADGRPTPLPVETASADDWNAHLPLLRAQFPSWTFDSGFLHPDA